MRSRAIEDESYWLKYVGNYKASGLNKHKYCKQHGIVYHRFLYWFAKLAVRQLQSRAANNVDDKQKNQNSNQFIKVKLSSEHNFALGQPCSAKPLCILELKQGHRLFIYNEDVLERIFLLLGE